MSAVSEANQLFKVEWIKPEVKREREEGAAEAAGDDAGKETKRTRIDSTEVAVKPEVKEEDSLDIGNVAKAFGDGTEGSDAIAKFERLWAEDPDQVLRSAPICLNCATESVTQISVEKPNL